MVKQIWRREFDLQVFRLEHSRPQDFLMCQWQTKQEVSVGYTVYRWLLACYFLVTLLCSTCRVSTDGVCSYKWLVYLTNWGYLVCTLQAVVSSCFLTRRLVAARRSGEDLTQEPMRLVYKVFWALHTTSVVVAYGISITYWATIYDPKVSSLDAMNVLVHAVNSVVMTADLLVVRHPVRLLHAYLPLSFTLVFFLFSVAYYLAGGTSRTGAHYIYSMLDWARPGRTVACCVVGLLFVSGVHAAVWALFLLRRWLYRRLLCREGRPGHCAVPSTSSEV